MTEVTQWATIFFFEEFANQAQLDMFEQFRTDFQKQWGHLFSERGQYYGREVGKRERLWEVILWNDEHCNEILENDPVFRALHLDFLAKVAPIDIKWAGVPVKGTSLHEVLAAGVVFLGFYILSPSQSPAGFESLTERLLDQLDYPGWQGLAYVSPVDAQGTALSMAAWDSIEATAQLGADGRFADLLDEANEAFDTAERTFMALVKFHKHVM